MIETGGRTDVIIQWFSSKYVHEHPKIFKKVNAAPNEAILFLKNGKVEKIVTGDQCKTDLGLWGRMIDWLQGSDKQMLIADLSPQSIQVPFTGYSKDRTKISGKVNLTIRIDAKNMLRLMNLNKRETVSDTKWLNTEFAKDIKEFTIEDILRYLSYDTSLVIDSSLLSQTMSSSIRDNMDEFNAKMRNVIDSMGVSWTSNGISIDYARSDIGENAYEDSMKYVDELAKIQIKQDADFADKEHELGLESNLNISVIKNSIREEMASIAGEYERNNYVISMENQNQLNQLDHEYAVIEKEMRNQLEIAKGQLEVDRINGISVEESAKRKTDLEAYDQMEKLKIQEYAKDQDVRRTIELLNAQREQDVERAFEDGKKQGKALAEQDEYEKGKKDGWQIGFMEGTQQAASLSKDIFGTAANGFQGRAMSQQPIQGDKKYCTSCGAPNPKDGQFCCKCGKQMI